MFSNLSKKEIEILDLIAHGYSNKQIVARLNIAEVTVRKYVSNIYSKTYTESLHIERFTVRIKLILLYLKYRNVLDNHWEVKDEI